MGSTLRSAISIALVSLPLTAGCLAHERPAPEPTADAGSVVRDAAAPVDAGALADAPRAADAAASCVQDETSVGVRIEAVTAETSRCVFTHAEGASLWGVDPAPADHGIRIHLDLCPAADADCRCDVVVSNVGEDVASTLGPDAAVTIDLEEGSGFVGPFLSITKVPSCTCDFCGCALPTYLYAGSVRPDAAPSVPYPLVFSRGAEVCPMQDCTFAGSSALHVHSDVSDIDVRGGETRDTGVVHVRALRDVEIYAPCAACAGCDVPVGAWIAWVTST
ncbi:MAG: hypothetical protein U0234_16755 [Sandaracinus sp.]